MPGRRAALHPHDDEVVEPACTAGVVLHGSVACKVVGAAQIRSILAASTTLVHLSMSAAMRALNASGLEGLGSLPTSLIRSMVAASARIVATSAFNRLTTGCGNPAGATSPCHEVNA